MATKTSSFGSGKRESHDSEEYYKRDIYIPGKSFKEISDTRVNECLVKNRIFNQSAESMQQIPDNSVALMITSPPYHVGKDYDSHMSFEDFLDLLERVFKETYRVLEPGGRAVINVANLGRRPYIPFTHLITERMLNIGFFMRGEIIWQKAKGAGGSCAWGSWRSPSNPVIRDIHEYCLCFSKGRFDRVVKGQATISKKEFMASTLSIWTIQPESASRIGHPAPFPVELPKRFIELYTYKNELVLDPFFGSGSTGIAAMMTNRNWIGYEINSGYVELAKERIDSIRV